MAHHSSLSDDRHPVDLLADEFAARLRSGESPSMQEYVDRYPEHAAEIEELFPGVALLEQLSVKQDSEASFQQGPPQDRLPAGHRFGDIEILREVGRGGMGIVYEAYQHSLNRPVAVKAISGSSVNSPNQLARFQREAQAAAQLHHTNIVPVFGVGEQQGMSYYVMQLIHGLGLDAVLSELSRKTHNRPPLESPRPDEREAVSARGLADVLVSGHLSESTIRAATGGGAGNSTVWRRGGGGGGGGSSVIAGLWEHATHGPTVVEAPSGDRTTEESGKKLPDGTPRAAVRSSQELREEDSPSPSVRSSLVLRDQLPSGEVFRGRPHAEAQDVQPTATVADPSLAALGARYWRNIARIGVQVASGLQYAHAQGTLHRDIKPANILLDSEGTAWIADFGLAKLLQQEDVTKTGDVVGTLRYMAPEQFRGETDGRSDLYSLGLTLYELVTLRPAYDDTDRQQLIAKKLTPHDPPHPRKLHPGIPRDLETIVLKCLAWEPDRRYQSAGALVADLLSFLEDRPIKARPITSGERLWRWCKRNPAIAGLSTAVLLLLMTTAAIATYGYFREAVRAETLNALHVRAQEGERTAKAKAQEAEDARARTEEIVELQWQALDSIYETFVPDRFTGPVEASAETTEEDVGVDAPSTATVLSPQTAALLEKMLNSFDQIAAVRGADERYLKETAKANQKVGDLHLRLGQHEEAIEAFNRSIARYRKLQEMNVEQSEDTLMLARLHNGLSVAYAGLGRRDEANEALEQTLAILSRPTLDQADPTVRFETAATHYLMGRRREFRGRRPRGTDDQNSNERGGRGRSDEATAGGRSPVRSDGGSGLASERGTPSSGGRSSESSSEDGSAGEGRSRSRQNRFRRGSDDRASREHLQTAIRMLAMLTSEHPTVPEYQFLSALCHIELSHPGMWPEGQSTQERLATAIGILERLVDQHPEEPDYVYQLSEAYKQRYYQWKPGYRPLFLQELSAAENKTDLQGISEAEHDLREAVRLSQMLMRQQPNVPRYAESQASLLFNLADVCAAEGKYNDARIHLNDAADLRQMIQERFPALETRSSYSELLLAHVEIGSQNYEAARDLLNQWIDRTPPPERGDGSHSYYDSLRRDLLGSVYTMLARAQEGLGNSAASAEARQRADEFSREQRERTSRGTVGT